MDSRIWMSVFVVVAMVIVILTPKLVWSKYEVTKGVAGYWLTQHFYVFGRRWSVRWYGSWKTWHVIHPTTGAYTPVGEQRAAWLDAKVMEWKQANANG